MANAASYDITIRQGNTLRRTFRFLTEEGEPVDLSGSALRFRVELGSRTGEFVTKASPVQLSMPTPTNGEVTLTLTPDETIRLEPGRVNKYEIERRIGPDEYTLLTGFLVGVRGVNDNA
jgi:hypothetical protein